MSITDLKKHIHNKIDKINDAQLLEDIDHIMDFVKSSREDWNDLPDNVRESIEKGIQQLDNGEKISFEDFKSKNSKWFTN